MSYELTSWLERLEPLMSRPALKRAEKATRGPEDPKWAIGDLLLEVPDRLIEPLAAALHIAPTMLWTYRKVAGAFPAENRTAASWAAHRELKDHVRRFELIAPGLSVREAALAAGKKPIDQPADRRQTPEQRADRIMEQLADPDVYALVMERVTATRDERKAKKAARFISEEMAARRKEAERELRAARDAKHPNQVFFEVRQKLIELIPWVEAIGLVADEGGESMMPEGRRAELVATLNELAEVTEVAARKVEGTALDHGTVIDVEPIPVDRD